MRLKLFSAFIFCGLWAPACRADLEPSLDSLIPLYVVEDIEGSGQVKILKEGSEKWMRAKEGQGLEEGDKIQVGADTEVVLILKSETLVHLNSNTELTVTRLAENKSEGFLTRLQLWTGQVLSDVKKNLEKSNSSFEVEAGGVVCGVRGTAFEVDKNGDDVETTVHEGTVDVRAGNSTRQVQAGQNCKCSKGNFHSQRPSSASARQRFQQWKDLKEQSLQHHDRRTGRKTGNRPLRTTTSGSRSGGRSYGGRMGFGGILLNALQRAGSRGISGAPGSANGAAYRK